MDFTESTYFADPAEVGGLVVGLLDSWAKGFFVLLVAVVLTLCMRRSASASRHLVWLLALAGALMIPIGAQLLPEWGVLPAPVAPVVESAPEPAAPAQSAVPEPPAVEPIEPQAVPDLAVPELLRRPPIWDPGPSAAASPILSTPAPPQLQTPEPTPKRIDVRWLLGIWLTGAVVLLMRLLRSRISLWRTASRATALEDGSVFDEIESIRNELGIRRPVVVQLGAPGTMPMVWGVFRSCLLLPEDARNWSLGRLRSVLLHELSHLRRADPLGLLVGHLAAIWHWPNPLAWIALRRLRSEAERACDDAVLRSGIVPSDYATEILDSSVQLEPAKLASAAFMMARPRGIELRITQILDRDRNRRPLARPTSMIAGALASIFAITIAVLGAKQEEEEPDAFLIQTLDPDFSIEVFPKSGESDRFAAIADTFREIGRQQAAAGQLGALVDTLNSVKVVEQRQTAATGAIRGAAELLPREALDLVPRIYIRAHHRRRIVADVLEDMLDRDVQAAAEFVAQNPDGGQVRNELLIRIAGKLPVDELEKNLAWASRLPTSTDQRTGRKFAILAFAAAHPGELVARLKSVTEPGRSQDAWAITRREDRIDTMNAAYASLHDKSPAAAHEWVRNLPVLSELPTDWPPKLEALAKPEDELAYAMTLPEGSVRRVSLFKKLVPTIATTDPARALKLALQIPMEDRERPVARILTRWAESDLERALALCDEHAGIVKGQPLEIVLSRLAKRDIAGAEEALERVKGMSNRSLTPGMVRFYALETIANAGQPGRAMELAITHGASVRNAALNWVRVNRTEFDVWLAAAPDKHRTPALAALAFHLHASDPSGAIEVLNELAKLNAPQTVIYDAQQTGAAVVAKLFDSDFEKVRDWVASIAKEEFGGPPARELMRRWLANDRDEAIEWMPSLPPSRGRDGVALTLLEHLAEAKPSTNIPRWPEDGPATSERTKDLEKRVLQYVDRVKATDRKAARRAVEVIGFDATARKRAMEALEKKEAE